MNIQECYASRDSVRIHYLDVNHDEKTNLTPLFMIPGGFGTAESFMPDFQALAPRRCIAVSQRGRGKSGIPITGYRYEDFVADFETVVDQTNVKKMYIYAFSLGVPTALGYALRHVNRVSGLIIGDFPAHYPGYPREWLKKFDTVTIDMVNMHAVRRVQAESVETPLWNELKILDCPVTIFKGDLHSGSFPVILTEDDLQKYRQVLPRISVQTFMNSGHLLWKPDPQRFIFALQRCLTSYDEKVVNRNEW